MITTKTPLGAVGAYLLVLILASFLVESAPAQTRTSPPVIASQPSSLEAGAPPIELLSPVHIGLRLGYLENFHQTVNAVCPTCGTYSNGTGSGYQAELFGELPFRFDRRLDLTFGFGFADRGGDFGNATISNLTVLDPNTNKYVPLQRESSYTSTLGYLNIATGLRFRPLARIPGYIGSSLDFGLPLGSSAHYTETEHIISPVGVYYPETGTTTRVDGSGVIPNLHMNVGISATVGYELAISPELTVAPELSYFYPLSNVESNFKWKVSSLRLAAALRWNRPPEFTAPAAPKPEPPPVAKPEDANAMAPALVASAADSRPLHIVETTVTETFPILPYIFFDSASSAISDRFSQLTPAEVQRFKESELPHRSLESYYNIMNIIGDRLRRSPSAHVTINGTTDGRESVNGDELAEARAKAVRDYLQQAWGIAPDRLIIKTSKVPTNPSTTEFAEGLEENRRVELTSDDDQLLKPIVHERFREESALPKCIPLQLAATSKIGLRDWRLAINVHGQPLYETSGSGTPPSSIEWKPNDGMIETVAKAIGPKDSLTVEFDAAASNGAHSRLTFPIAAGKTINPFELSRLSLIVFDFDQSAIGEQNRRMISSFVAKSLYPASTATITGSTDNLGELKHNEKLSTDRAMNVRTLVLAEKPDARITSTIGVGPSRLLYDNHLPEGRYYCRTVRVEVETPLESVVHGQ